MEHLKEYISERENCIDREIDKKLDNPFLNAYYNGVKMELAAIRTVIDALIEKQNVLDKMSNNKKCSLCKNYKLDDSVSNSNSYGDKYGICIAADEIKSNGNMDAVCSASGIGGELIVREDFGCILFCSL